MTEAASFLIPFLLVFGLTPCGIRLASRLHLIDRPDERKNHHEPTPVAGGLILFPIALAAVLAGFAGDPRLGHVLAGTTVIFLVGLWDDWKWAHFSTKFLAQAVAALTVMQSGLWIDLNSISIMKDLLPIRFEPLASTFGTLLWIVGVTNAVNLIDGMDGLAAGLCFNALAGIAVLDLVGGQGRVGLMCLILAGGILGFLRYNIYPARTFLGDSGSLLLGFIIAVASIARSAKTSTFLVLVVPVLFLAIPMTDTVLAFSRRVLRGQNPFAADREHLHHRLLALHFTPRQTLGYFYAFSATLGLAAVWLAQTRQIHIIGFALTLVAIMTGFVKALQRYNFHDRISMINRRVSVMAKRAARLDSLDQGYQRRMLMALGTLTALNAVIAMSVHPLQFQYLLLLLVPLGVGVVDYLVPRGDAERSRGSFLGLAFFFSLLILQLLVLTLDHGPWRLSAQMLASFFLIIGLTSLHMVLTRTMLLFLAEPLEIIALYSAVLLSGLVKHQQGDSDLLPYALAVASSLALFSIAKTTFMGARVRSRLLLAGVTASTAFAAVASWLAR